MSTGTGTGNPTTSALDASGADVHDGGLCPIVGGDIGWVSPVDLGNGTTETVCPGRCGAWIIQDNVTGKIIDRER
ncbi:hypothetical protein [Cryobacterium zhongshanensis]|uniref:Uncharacterized protein n=1 Tax=Cryobacterium zhongshanensis TaxID=2928153 RepID=A0AA41UGF4_9MICO|nr:hypothetical protein [Cryobacterium zhongshanensis]MCI4659678.1 hypothetical protein [Cryobacterium zhongshanensis]